MTKNFNHLFTIIDNMVADARADIEADGDIISCRRGCNYCCHLLVEVSFEEALELGKWIMSLPEPKHSAVIARVKDAAGWAREFFTSYGGERFLDPIAGELDIPDELFDKYLYEGRRACPFLVDGECEAYEVRPTPCRMHLVSSPPFICSPDVTDEELYEIPERIEQLQEDAAPVVESMEKDGRSGELGIMVEAALFELGLLSRQVRDQKKRVEDKEAA